MWGIKINCVALVAVLALSSIGTASALAKAPKLDLIANSQAVSPGAPLFLTSFEFSLASPTGSVHCLPSGPMLAVDKTNGAKTDEIQLIPNLGALTFLYSHVCVATTGLGNAASVYVSGPISVTESLNVKSSGKSEFASNVKEPLAIAVDYEATGDGCRYTAPKFKGTVTLGTVKAMEIFISQKLKLDHRDSSPPCPKTATFTSSVVAHDGNEFVFDHVEP
jgi:hypothetical protein